MQQGSPVPVPEALCFASPIYGYQNSSCLVLALLLGDLNRLFRLLWFWNRLLIHLRSGFCARFGFGYRRGGFVVKHRWFPFVDWPFVNWGYRYAWRAAIH